MSEADEAGRRRRDELEREADGAFFDGYIIGRWQQARLDDRAGTPTWLGADEDRADGVRDDTDDLDAEDLDGDDAFEDDAFHDDLGDW